MTNARLAIPVVLAAALGLVVGLLILRPTSSDPAQAPMISTHPGDDGSQLLSSERRAQLDQRTALRMAQGIPPRTRHLQPDGTPRYTNRLVETSSPYLHQHAHNPVGWFPWGDEAFELAAKLDRPVLLSIGYATCHWCHVMEEESFEDPEIAAWINAHFIPVKVDRETRPDLDAVYMAAVTASIGRGGWPATLVLRPDKLPFFAATYLPARAGDRGRSQGLLTLLQEIAGDWEYDVVSIGYPGPVRKGAIAKEPHNLGKGWMGFDFEVAFKKPVRIINDAAMQALGSHQGGTMLFLGFGTGLGSALVAEGSVIPMELAHLPYKKSTYEAYLGERGRKKLGNTKRRKHVTLCVKQLRAALQSNDVVLGGGNAKRLKELPEGSRLGSNANAFIGGYRMWESAESSPESPNSSE